MQACIFSLRLHLSLPLSWDVTKKSYSSCLIEAKLMPRKRVPREEQSKRGLLPFPCGWLPHLCKGGIVFKHGQLLNKRARIEGVVVTLPVFCAAIQPSSLHRCISCIITLLLFNIGSLTKHLRCFRIGKWQTVSYNQEAAWQMLWGLRRKTLRGSLFPS